jgi:hypothetical protein
LLTVAPVAVQVAPMAVVEVLLVFVQVSTPVTVEPGEAAVGKPLNAEVMSTAGTGSLREAQPGVAGVAVQVALVGGVPPPVGSTAARLITVVPAEAASGVMLIVSALVPPPLVIVPLKLQLTVVGPATAGVPVGVHVQPAPLKPV